MPKQSKSTVKTTPPLTLVEAHPSRQEHVDLQSLAVPMWENPREPVKPDQVRGLSATMDRFGLLQPIVVVPCPEQEGFYFLLAGHRRVAAARMLAWKTIPAHVLMPAKGAHESLEHLARAVALVENGQRQDLDPLRDCEVVECLLREDGATLESVAAELGRPKSWVARRARLSGLCSAARKAAKPGGPIAHWPAAWLEDLALLSPEQQEALARAQGPDGTGQVVTSAEVLRAAVRAMLKRLGSAPWDLEDGGIYKQAGPCSTCSKHTGAQRDLFSEPKKFELAEAQCLDSACFETKASVWKATAIEQARLKHGPDLLVVEGQRDGWDGGAVKPEEWTGTEIAREVEREAERDEEASPAVQEHGLTPAKKTDKGARPALIVSGKDAGKVKWVAAPTESKPKGRVTGTASPAAKREKLEERRRAQVVLFMREIVEEWATGKRSPELEAVLESMHCIVQIASAWGADVDATEAIQNQRGRQKMTIGAVRQELCYKPETACVRLLAGVIAVWARNLGTYQAFDVRECYAEVEAILIVTGQRDLLTLIKGKARAACPWPKSWGPEPDLAPEPKAATKTTCRIFGVDDTLSDAVVEWSEPNLCKPCSTLGKVEKPAKGRKGAKKS